MKCPFPKYLRVRNSSTGVIETQGVPCGKCDVCKQNKMKDWLFRLQFDVDASVNCFFVTLTYNDENLPEYVCKEDVQKFFKRLRKRCVKPSSIHPNIEYFIVSEYGSLRNRPHYHAVVMNVVPLEGSPQDAIDKAWQNGFVYIGTVTPASLRYVLKYIQKDAELPVDKFKSLFYLMSKGIGRTFLTISNGQNVSNLGGRLSTSICLDGIKHVMPRYFQTKIYGDRRRFVFDRAKRIYDDSRGLSDMSQVELEEYFNQEREKSLSYISQLQRRERLAKLGVRNAGKI